MQVFFKISFCNSMCLCVWLVSGTAEVEKVLLRWLCAVRSNQFFVCFGIECTWCQHQWELSGNAKCRMQSLFIYNDNFFQVCNIIIFCTQAAIQSSFLTNTECIWWALCIPQTQEKTITLWKHFNCPYRQLIVAIAI